VLIPLSRAREIIERVSLPSLKPVPTRIREAVGRISCSELRAGSDFPEADLSVMDGYAFKLDDLKRGKLRTWRKAFPWSDSLKLEEGEAVYVTTGTKIPEGADTVARIEGSKVIDGFLQVSEEVFRWKDVEKRGEVIRRGEGILRRGEVIRPYHMGLLTALGVEEVQVCRAKVGVFGVGDELHPFDSPPAEGKRPDSVSPVLTSLLSRVFDVQYYGVIRDDEEEIIETVRRGVEENDMVLAIGGSSVGEKDLTKGALAKCGNLLFEGINVNVIKRGSVGIVKGKPVVILPGQIVAAVCTFHEHGLHILERMLGVELRRSDDLPLGSDLEVRHKMDSLYLVSIRGGRAYPLRWGVGLYKELTEAEGFTILKRGRKYVEGETIHVQYLL